MYSLWLLEWQARHIQTKEVRQRTYFWGAATNAFVFVALQWLVSFCLIPSAGPHLTSTDVFMVLIPLTCLNTARFFLHARDWASFILSDPLDMYAQLERLTAGQPAFELPAEFKRALALFQWERLDGFLAQIMGLDDMMCPGEMQALVTALYPYREKLKYFDCLECYCMRAVRFHHQERKILFA